MNATELSFAASELSKVIPLLPESKHGFASSLVDQAQKKGKLSEKQEYWLLKLHEMAVTPKPEPETVDLGVSAAGIIALFNAAKVGKKKHPKVRLNASGQEIVLSVAGSSAKVPGSINVTSKGGFHDRDWYGRIHPDGRWEPSAKGKKIELLEDLLFQFAQDPAGVAAAYGKMTGACCFCLKPLDTDESLAVGYGPTCAKKWNLPWGKKHVH